MAIALASVLIKSSYSRRDTFCLILFSFVVVNLESLQAPLPDA